MKDKADRELNSSVAFELSFHPVTIKDGDLAALFVLPPPNIAIQPEISRVGNVT